MLEHAWFGSKLAFASCSAPQKSLGFGSPEVLFVCGFWSRWIGRLSFWFLRIQAKLCLRAVLKSHSLLSDAQATACIPFRCEDSGNSYGPMWWYDYSLLIQWKDLSHVEFHSVQNCYRHWGKESRLKSITASITNMARNAITKPKGTFMWKKEKKRKEKRNILRDFQCLVSTICSFRCRQHNSDNAITKPINPNLFHRHLKIRVLNLTI